MRNWWVLHVEFGNGVTKWQGVMSGRVDEETAKRLLLEAFKEQYDKPERIRLGGARWALSKREETESDYSKKNESVSGMGREMSGVRGLQSVQSLPEKYQHGVRDKRNSKQGHRRASQKNRD